MPDIPAEADTSLNTETLMSKEGEEGNPTARVYIGEDAEFIAHARQDIPDLLAEVTRLRNWPTSCGTPPTSSAPSRPSAWTTGAATATRVGWPPSPGAISWI